MRGWSSVKIVVAAVQMPSEPLAVSTNLDRADCLLKQASESGADLAVLPEMFNTGYGLMPDYGQVAETVEGPTLAHLRARSREWGMAIAAGFVERDRNHLYDALAFCTPEGTTSVYRKRHLVFWERFRFYPGTHPLIVPTRWGRIGFAVCADMIYRRVWAEYRGRIDLAVVSAAWPDFANRHTGQKHWLFGHIGAMSAEIPHKVAHDLGIPVVFANQCGATQTTIPYLGTWITERIVDRFAGQSSVCDGRHGGPLHAGSDEEVLLSSVTIHPPRGPVLCRSMSPSVREESSFGLARS
jgi:N-carbamoylputrescine amidase